MGLKSRLRKERIDKGEEEPRARSSLKQIGQEKLLERAIDKGQLSRDAALQAAKEGMQKHLKHLRGKNKAITIESIMEEINARPEFLRQMARLNISAEDFTNLAKVIIDTEE